MGRDLSGDLACLKGDTSTTSENGWGGKVWLTSKHTQAAKQTSFFIKKNSMGPRMGQVAPKQKA